MAFPAPAVATREVVEARTSSDSRSEHDIPTMAHWIASLLPETSTLCTISSNLRYTTATISGRQPIQNRYEHLTNEDTKDTQH